MKNLHKGKKLVGRAVTCTFMPTRPDLFSVVKEMGDQHGWEGTCNQWVVDNLVEGDVVVADMFDKVFNGTFAGGNLTTAINVKTKTGGAVIWGGVRDIEQMSKIDTQIYFRGVHPTPIRECVMTGYNMACRIGEAVCLPGDVVMGTPSGVLFIPASNEPNGHAGASIWRLPRGSKTPLLAAGFLTPSFCVAEVINSAEKTHAKDIFGFAMLEQGIYTTAEIDSSVWSTEMLTRLEAFIQEECCGKYRALDWSQERRPGGSRRR